MFEVVGLHERRGDDVVGGRGHGGPDTGEGVAGEGAFGAAEGALGGGAVDGEDVCPLEEFFPDGGGDGEGVLQGGVVD